VNRPVHRSVVWLKPAGAELVDVEMVDGRLTAVGTTIGADPVPYRATYSLITGDDYVTRILRVKTSGAGWRRTLEIRRDDDGTWRSEAVSEGDLAAPYPGGDVDAFRGVLDCDLGLSPITNTPPVRRHGLLAVGQIELTMPWVSMPDLVIEPLPQRYTHLRRENGYSVVRFESEGFGADIVFDSDGLVVDYPGIARRADQT
jgi:uncharacterized protein